MHLRLFQCVVAVSLSILFGACDRCGRPVEPTTVSDSDGAPRESPAEGAASPAAAAADAAPQPVAAEAAPPAIRLGIISFLSGAGAGPFGVPARNAAELLVEELNNGRLPPPYDSKGFGGIPLETVFVDENGGASRQVTEYRNLVQQREVDIVIGYTSSGDCLAIAPIAEELKKLTVFFDCGTPRIFEESSYKYVFRTAAHGTMDSVGAALYVSELKPSLKRIAGVNQNYAYGQDSWNDFEASMKALKPDVQVTASQMPKLGAGQYGAEVSSLLAGGPDVIHSSFWGGDLEAFVLQAAPRGLFRKSTVLLTAGETAIYRLASQMPDGTVIGARGPNGVFSPDTELNRWFKTAYRERFALYPNYPAYHMVQAILGVKSAYEKALGAAGGVPTQDQVISAFEGLVFESPAGKVQMSLGKGHQAIQGTAYGMIKTVRGQMTLTSVRHYAPDRVNPPEGIKSSDWIASGFKAK
jgi:branched-chain amino acid transport system substrate-binding protein